MKTFCNQCGMLEKEGVDNIIYCPICDPREEQLAAEHYTRRSYQALLEEWVTVVNLAEQVTGTITVRVGGGQIYECSLGELFKLMRDRTLEEMEEDRWQKLEILMVDGKKYKCHG